MSSESDSVDKCEEFLSDMRDLADSAAANLVFREEQFGNIGREAKTFSSDLENSLRLYRQSNPSHSGAKICRVASSTFGELRSMVNSPELLIEIWALEQSWKTKAALASKSIRSKFSGCLLRTWGLVGNYGAAPLRMLVVLVISFVLSTACLYITSSKFSTKIDVDRGSNEIEQVVVEQSAVSRLGESARLAFFSIVDPGHSDSEPEKNWLRALVFVANAIVGITLLATFVSSLGLYLLIGVSRLK